MRIYSRIENITWVATVAVLLATVLVAGCANFGGDTRKARGTISKELRSGFLEDYNRLEAVAGDKTVLRWSDPDVNWSKYTRAIVDPVEFRVPPSFQEEVQPKPEVVAAITKYYRDAVIRNLEPYFEIVDEPGAGVLRLRGAVTSINPTAKQLKVWQFLPAVLVVTVAGEITGLRSKNVVVFTEGKISDSVNGRLLWQVMKGRESQRSGPDEVYRMTVEQINPILDYWGEETARLLNEAKAKSP